MTWEQLSVVSDHANSSPSSATRKSAIAQEATAGSAVNTHNTLLAMSENEIAKKITDEFCASETLSIDIKRLDSLFALLGQLGWSIASQDSQNRDSYHLHGQARDTFSTQTIPRKQFLVHLRSQISIRYLHESSQLIIWRNQEFDTILPREESDPLTKRESEVHTLLLDGTTLPHIAQELGISPRTVEKHVQNLYRKKGVRSYNELLFNSPKANNRVRS